MESYYKEDFNISSACNMHFTKNTNHQYNLEVDDELKAQLLINKETNEIDYYVQHVKYLDLYEICQLLELVACKHILTSVKTHQGCNIIDYLLKLNNIKCNESYIIQDLCYVNIRICSIESDIEQILVKPIAHDTLEINEIKIKDNLKSSENIKSIEMIKTIIDESIVQPSNIKYKIISYDDMVLAGLINNIKIKDDLLKQIRRFECFDIDNNLIYFFEANKKSHNEHTIRNSKSHNDSIRELANRIINYQCIVDNLENKKNESNDIQDLLYPIIYEYNNQCNIKVVDYSTKSSDFNLTFNIEGDKCEGYFVINMKHGIILDYFDNYSKKIAEQILNKIRLTINQITKIKTNFINI